ncbi:unnamed protein product [Chrysoparadoxa australica]
MSDREGAPPGSAGRKRRLGEVSGISADDTGKSGTVQHPRRWSPDEDNRLREAVNRMGEANWKAIATHVDTRNHVQCLQRWKKVLKPGLVKGPWTVEEDSQLIALVDGGFKNWGQLASRMEGRTSKQCRERWRHHLDPSINRGEWSAEEDKMVYEIHMKVGNRWSQIAQLLPGRTENAIKHRFKALERQRVVVQSAGDNDIDGKGLNDELPAQPRRWTTQEDEALKEAVAEIGEMNWKEIASRVESRNHVQCLQRWKKVLKPGLVKGHWSPEEDSQLMQLISEGHSNWGPIAAKLPGRTSKQCRERWRHHLDPSINRGDWSAREDSVIVDMQAKVGNKWAQIAQMLRGRTENSIKMRFRLLEQERLQPGSALPGLSTDSGLDLGSASVGSGSAGLGGYSSNGSIASEQQKEDRGMQQPQQHVPVPSGLTLLQLASTHQQQQPRPPQGGSWTFDPQACNEWAVPVQVPQQFQHSRLNMLLGSTDATTTGLAPYPDPPVTVSTAADAFPAMQPISEYDMFLLNQNGHKGTQPAAPQPYWNQLRGHPYPLQQPQPQPQAQQLHASPLLVGNNGGPTGGGIPLSQIGDLSSFTDVADNAIESASLSSVNSSSLATLLGLMPNTQAPPPSALGSAVATSAGPEAGTAGSWTLTGQSIGPAQVNGGEHQSPVPAADPFFSTSDFDSSGWGWTLEALSPSSATESAASGRETLPGRLSQSSTPAPQARHLTKTHQPNSSVLSTP